MATNAKLQRFEALRSGLDDRISRLPQSSRAEEIVSEITSMRETLASVGEQMKEALRRTLAEIERSVAEAKDKLKDTESCLDSDQSKLSHQLDELDRLKSAKAESGRQLLESQTALDQSKREAELLGSAAMETVEAEKQFPLLMARKNFFYMATRVNWEVVSGSGNAVKGFVINPIKNDLSTFKLDRRGLDKVTSCKLLWDYIGAGVSSEWSKI